MIHQPTERQKWFESRIGKFLFRNGNGCRCVMCLRVKEEGVFVTELLHARYLYDNECDYNREGTPLRYFDTKEDLNEWLKTLPNEEQ